MKKIRILVVSMILMMIAVMLTGCENIKEKEEKQYDDYYKLSYSASYGSPSVLKDKSRYEIVTNQTRLNEILNKIDNEESAEKFNDDFFENKNLLVVNGGVNSKINKLKINKTEANIEIYYASPLTSLDTIWKHDIYLIPVSKDVTDINIEKSVYPDRVY